MGTLHHLHRVVELPIKTLDDLAREHGVEAPRDYAPPFTFVASRNQPTFGEKLVDFARRWQFRFAVASYVIAVAAGCYFAFQVGRGVWL